MRVQIIMAAPQHLDGIMVIENLSFRIPWSRDAMLEEITGNKFAYYLCAAVEDRVVGYAGMWHVCDEGHITNIAVHPEFRGEGVGSALMEGLIGHAVETGIVAMTLEVRKSNIVAQALYRKFGFVDAGFRKAYYADNGEDALIMWKNF